MINFYSFDMYLYLLYYYRNLFDIRFKIGIGWHLHKRLEQIDRTTDGEQKLLFAVLLPFGARRVERIIHKLYQGYHAPLKSGSGKTEYFRLGIRVIEVALLMVVVMVVEWAMVAASFSGVLMVLMSFFNR
jgi:hypothetical protein